MTYTKTETAGFYKALLTQPSHKTEIRNFAVNVDPGEGDLRALAGPDLASRLAPLKYEFEYASKYDTKLDETQGRNLGDSLLLMLLIVLIVEQWFAWSCSYHVSSRMTNPWKWPSSRETGRPGNDLLLLVAAGRNADHDEIRVRTNPVQRRLVDVRRHSAGDPCPACSGSTAAIRASCPGISAWGCRCCGPWC